MNKTIIGLVVIVIIAAGALFYQRSTRVPESPVKVAVLAPLTGIVADYGEEIKKGVESVAGGAPSVQFVFEDDQCDPKIALSAFKKVTEFDHVNFILGPACGTPQEVIAPLLTDGTKVALVSSAASNNLFARSGGNLYNMQYSLEDEARFIANTMYARGHKNVVLISYQNEFSKAETDAFKAAFQGSIVKDVVLTTGSSDVQTELTKLKSEKFDAVFVVDISFYFAGGLQKFNTLGLKAPIFSPYTVELPAVRTLVEGVYYAFPKDITDGKGGVYGIAAEAAKLYSAAINKCGDDVACVKKFIKASGFDEYGVKQRELVLKQIINGQPVIVNN